ncbi:hypothetical protein OLP41_gp008 [Mycobacterium phage I3]|uniref:Uncharacterized protein n=1 Tax=Mycobacterium phage I3 TaxID=2994057 RepID=A0A8F2E7D6_9CAUD|nr:hypothetical protein OLP41_gp008 [Mycobacterium phage I3]QWT30294.1 hypothetical protein PBI_I3_8 [Mycobacterium phage I3]
MSDAAERAKAALEEATEGPWLYIPGGSEDALVVSEGEREPNAITVGGVSFHPGLHVAVDLRDGDAEFIAQARTLVPELIAEVERLRSYKSLPLDMVWQDYYSPDDVLKIRQPLDAEIEQLRAEVERLNEIIEQVGEVADSYKLIEDTQILAIINPNGASDE